MKRIHWTITTLLATAVIMSGCTGIPPTAPDVVDAVEPKPSKVSTEESIEIPTRPFPDDSFHDLLVAEFAVRRKRFDIALGTYLQQAHATRDKAVIARATRLAQFLQADNATLDAAQLWVEVDPTNLEAQYSTATILAKNRRPLEAIQHMAIVLEQGGKTNFAAIIANSMSLPSSILEEIEISIDQLQIQHPQEPQLITAKALLLQQRGETNNALGLIQKVLAIDENDTNAVVIEARMLQQLKRYEEAFTRLQETVEKQPNNRRLRLEYARLLMTKSISKAQIQFELLLQQPPHDPDLLLSLALINKETKNFDQANYYFERLIAIGKRSDEARLHLGQIAERQNDRQKAIEYYSIIKPGRNFLAATNRIVALYLNGGLVQTALEYLQSLRQQYPEHSMAIYLVEAEVLLRSKMYEDGHKLITEALVMEPEHPNLLYVRSLFSEKRSDLDLMERDLQLIINMDPENATALNALGYVLANNTERLEQAHDLIKRALAIRPEEPAIMDSLGWVEFRRGNFQRSLELLSKAHKLFPDPEIAAHLGEVLWSLGKKEKAKLTWREALKRNPDSDVIEETIERLLESSEAAEELKNPHEDNSKNDLQSNDLPSTSGAESTNQ
jgi:tetratricopeptide (TPR) repeat protein